MPLMTKTMRPLTYRSAGVDIVGADRFVDAILGSMRSTYDQRVIRRDGGYAGLMALRRPDGRKFRDPVLVGCTDGVGTKLKLAFDLDRHDTVGIDLVAMNVNDLIVTGGRPLFFLDYIATGKISKRILADVVKGIAEGCRQSGAALLGGETAEMPGFYKPGEYDLAGFAVGAVERTGTLEAASVRPGDIAIGIPSSGVHSNGYSLVRKIVSARRLKLSARIPEFGRKTLGEELLTPTRIYVRLVEDLLAKFPPRTAIRGLAHITGSGLPGNCPRILPKGCGLELWKGSWPVPPVFGFLQREGNVPEAEMYDVFNMGLGLVVITASAKAEAVLDHLHRRGEDARVVGRVVRGKSQVRFSRAACAGCD